MQIDLLLNILKLPLAKNKVEELAKDLSKSELSVQQLIDLSFHKQEQLGFRASWILENVYTNHLDQFLPKATYFLGKFHQQNNLSSRRPFSKILALMTAKKAAVPMRNIIENFETDALVETVFNWLIDVKVPVAVKSHCLNILANLISKHGWIRDELIETMDFLIDKESIAFYAKVKQIRKQLAKL